MSLRLRVNPPNPNEDHLCLPNTGVLRAIIEAQPITDLKTASDSVLDVTLLARPDSKHLVIVCTD